MAGNSEEPQSGGRAAARAARQAEINALAKSTYRAYRKSGDNSVFNDLLDTLSPYTRPTLRNSFGIRNPDHQEDVFQEIAVHFLSYAHRYDEERPFLPWWHTIVRRVTLDFLNNSAKQLRYENSGTDERVIDASVAGRQPESQTAKAILEEALNSLRSDDRHILNLYFAENFTAQEISEQVHKPVPTVKYHIRRARAQIREFLEPGSAKPKTQNPQETPRPLSRREELREEGKRLLERFNQIWNSDEEEPDATGRP
ncbi:MAG TPA: sigma-70 family RNA polymerase sigma factor [Bryobacteraceae bacterium]|jgi:RNA polymerase sigma-70 factor (ECF subfamily)